MTRTAVRFFDQQFRRQVSAGDYALNPFETAVLPHLSGRVLDLGCGLGNLALAAADSGCDVTAVDASPTAVADLSTRAQARGRVLHAQCADLADFEPDGSFDAIVCIGLLMFFDCARARMLLDRWQRHVRPGGLMAVNVLVEGTTFMDMFDPVEHCLFTDADLDAAFRGWTVVLDAHQRFDAPRGTVKAFRTLIARR